VRSTAFSEFEELVRVVFLDGRVVAEEFPEAFEGGLVMMIGVVVELIDSLETFDEGCFAH
jgi:hypothetical protein